MIVRSLVEIDTGQSGTVTEVRGGGGLRRRLDAMGIRLGTQLTKTSGSYLRGPVTVRTGNAQLALGFGMASRVFVSLEGEGPT
jgi:Fe2+ transport system protein FeoA